jgi:hypothetical protein
MMDVASKLYEVFEGGGNINPAIAVDLFGYLNWTKEMKSKNERDNVMCIYEGLYKGLYLRKVSSKEIMDKYYNNKLDELMEEHYDNNKSLYYQEYCNKQMKIGNTYEE